MYPFSNSTLKTCFNCSVNCRTCTNDTFCTRCTNTTLLYNDGVSAECLNYCPVGYYASQGTCQPCATGCLSCYLNQGALTCGECLSFYYLLNGECLTICPSGYYSAIQNTVNVCLECASNCAQCDISSTNCTLCKNANYTEPGCSSQTCTTSQY